MFFAIKNNNSSLFYGKIELTTTNLLLTPQNLASMTLFDTSGIKAFVTENNPKFTNRMVAQLKTYANSQGLDGNYNPYKAVYKNMPSHASANPAIKQLYINGHFYYDYKFGMITNGLGIVRDITFYNKDFLDAHPGIIVEKKSDSPDDDKSLSDSKALIPVLIGYLKKASVN